METNLGHTVVMVLSFMFGGFLLTTYAFTAYTVLWSTETGAATADANRTGQETNASWTADRRDMGRGREVPGFPPFIQGRPIREKIDPIDFLTSPFMMFTLIGGLVSMAGAISIRTLTHKKAVTKLKEDLMELYLTDEEKKVMSILESASPDMTQKELTDRTRYSRVKVHRLLLRLEAKRLIRRIPCGQTYKILIAENS